ncbi:MAG: hypothetical protein KDA85_19125, partial [Planctomycetaceae bacterium]|nr:hypothetical protein [Planctomycetaceae bacterium]
VSAIPSSPSSTAVARITTVSQSTDTLVALVQETRESTRRRILSTDTNSPWQIMHAVLALRQDLQIKHQGNLVSALDWISTGPTYRNEYWFEKTQFGGRAHPYNQPKWFEGHINQTLALLSMSGLPLDHEFGVANGQKIRMRDLLRNAQMTVNNREEVTWTLWALSRYLPPDAQWVNAAGEQWSIERLVKMEVDKSLEGAPCGGTHRMFVLAHARNVYLRTGKPLQGVWLEAEHKIRRHIQTARMLQNSNGTLSSNFFRGRDYKPDFDKRMWSAGHVLEFLMIALPQEELSEPWVRRAIEATCRDLLANRYAKVDCSPLYHSVNALTIYLERVAPPTPQQALAAPDNTKTISSPKVTDPATAETKTESASSPPAATDGSSESGTAPAVSPMPTTAGETKSGDSNPVEPSAATPAEEAGSESPQSQPVTGASPAVSSPDPGTAKPDVAPESVRAPSESAPPVAASGVGEGRTESVAGETSSPPEQQPSTSPATSNPGIAPVKSLPIPAAPTGASEAGSEKTEATLDAVSARPIAPDASTVPALKPVPQESPDLLPVPAAESDDAGDGESPAAAKKSEHISPSVVTRLLSNPAELNRRHADSNVSLAVPQGARMEMWRSTPTVRRKQAGFLPSIAVRAAVDNAINHASFRHPLE